MTRSRSPSNNNGFVTLEPWAEGNVAAQFQALYYSTEVGGSSRTITGFDWMKYATSFATTCQNVSIYLGHTSSGGLSTNFTGNYSSTPTHCVNGVTYQIPIGTFTFQAGPTFTTNFSYDGTSNLILEVQHTGSSGGGFVGGTAVRGYAEWLENLAAVERRISQLESLGAELRRMIAECRGGRTADCRILEVLGDHGQCLADAHEDGSPAPGGAQKKRGSGKGHSPIRGT